MFMYACMYVCKYRLVWSGLAWHGMAWNGMEWNGTVWYGMYIHMPSGYINIAMENGPFVDDF